MMYGQHDKTAIMNKEITRTMTLREVMVRYPGTVTIFNRYGLTGCGGPKGPLEPIAFFATVHHVEPEALLRELNEFVARGNGAVPEVSDERVTKDLYPTFLKAAIVVALTAGVSLGAATLAGMAWSGTAASAWKGLTQAHGFAQIFGWVGLFVMGIVYHVIPRLKGAPLHSQGLARSSFFFMVAGLVLRVASVVLPSQVQGFSTLLSTGLVLAAVSLFAYVALATLAASPQPFTFYEKYIVASIVWLWAFAANTLVLTAYNVQRGLESTPETLNAPYLHLGLWGFAVMVILGMTLRTIPVFMGRGQPNKKAFDLIFWMLNGGIVLHVGGGYWQAVTSSGVADYLAAAGALLEMAAILSYVAFLNPFPGSRSDRAEPGVERGYEVFVRAAYLWLVVATLMSVGYTIYSGVTGNQVTHSLVGAYRHALTVGFITMMIFGMAHRILPVFGGVRLYNRGFMMAAFILLNLGNGLRVVSQPLADIFGGVFFPIMGSSGFIELLATVFFGYNIWRTIDQRWYEGEARPTPVAHGNSKDVRPSPPVALKVTKDSLVGPLIDRFPQALEVFVKHGFVMLQDDNLRRTMAGTVTIDMACNIHHADREKLVADLNLACLGSGVPR
ncbi:MAG: DUF1858 domain-containing protein [Chloroflexi bacterium]|nr:DUF1858 domain-containing protein [Chloroflexota bacterium]